MLKKKDKLFLKKQIKKLILKKKFNFKLEYTLEYLKLFMILNTFSIIVFSQFISLDSEKDNKFYLTLSDKNIKCVYIKQSLLKKLFHKFYIPYIKNFNNLFYLNDINNIDYLKKNILLNKKIIIIGFLFNNIFFFKNDFNLNNLSKKKIYLKILKLRINFIKLLQKIILILKSNIYLLVSIFKNHKIK